MGFRDQRVTQVPVLLFTEMHGDTKIPEEKRPKLLPKLCCRKCCIQQMMFLTHVTFNSV